MKNITSVASGVSCSLCKLNGYICFTPNGGDYTTCPLCNYGEYGSSPTEENYDTGDFIDDDNDLRNRLYYLYCDNCRVLFQTGCKHAENGCSASYFNGHMVGKWKYKGVIYIGMPQFDDVHDWYNNVNDIEILEWVCPNKGVHCDRAGYPESSCPQYYDKCDLQK